MISLVSTEDAIAHLRESTDKHAEVRLKTSIACEIVMRHIKLEEIPDDWITEEEPGEAVDPALVIYLGPNMDESPLPSPPTNRWAIVPGMVYAACLLVLGEIYERREASANPLSPTVVNMLAHYRRPTVGSGANIEDDE